MVTGSQRRTEVVAGIALGVLGVCTDVFGATLTLGNATAFPGFGQANMPVTLSLEPGEYVAGVQWDLVFDSSVLNLYAIYAGPSAIDAGKSVSFSIPSPGKVHVLVTGFNANVIVEGVLVTVAFTVPSGVPGIDQEVLLDKVIFAHPYGIDIAAEGISGVLTIDEEALSTGWNSGFGLSTVCLIMLISCILCLRKKRKG